MLDSTFSKRNHCIVLGAVLLFQFLTLIFPIIKSGVFALGYDAGFYRRYLLNESSALLGAAVPGLDHTVIAPRIWLSIVNILSPNIEIALFGSYIILILLTTFLFYLLTSCILRKNTALIATFFVSISPIVYHAYWYMFYKNFFALALLFLLVYLISKSKLHLLRIMLPLIIVISHQTTSFFLFVFLSIYISIQYFRHKKIELYELISLTFSLLLYFYFHPNIQGKIEAPPVGIFLTHTKFILLILGFSLLSMFGIKKYWTVASSNTSIAAFSIVSILFPLFSLPYYQRIYLYSFFAVAIIAALGVEYLILNIEKYRRNIRIVITMFVFICVAYQIGALLYIISIDKPLISKLEQNSLAKLYNVLPTNAKVITNAKLVPWVQGWSRAQVFGPGLLKDRYSPSDWMMYWGGEDREKAYFLSQYPKPLYIFINGGQKREYVPSNCATEVYPMLYSVDECI